MPSPRAARGRDFTAASLQFDTTGDPRHQNAYQNQRRRDVAARTADNYPSPRPRPRPRTRNGYPVTVRNGLPGFRPYTYRGAGHDILECDCHA